MEANKVREIIQSEVQKMKGRVKQTLNKTIADDRAFSYVILGYIFDVEFIDQDDLVTDGSNDGGIDFVYYDEEESKVIVGQSKYTGKLSFDSIIDEFGKMYSTVQNFKISNTGSYNDRLKRVLQNALDRLPDENTDNIEYNLFTSAPVDVEGAMKKIANTQHKFSADAIRTFADEDVKKEIETSLESLKVVKYEKIELDQANNYLKYESAKNRGIMCNVLSTSVIRLYDKYVGKGLFDLNIRKYIRHKSVDTGIKSTLDREREDFWFFNNGIIIACEDFEIDGNTVELEGFSIVNGGKRQLLSVHIKVQIRRNFIFRVK